jgi:hypothetical protein
VAPFRRIIMARHQPTRPVLDHSDSNVRQWDKNTEETLAQFLFFSSKIFHSEYPFMTEA